MSKDLFGRRADQLPFNATIDEIQREIGQRKRLYPRWVAAKKLNAATADIRIACLERAIKELRKMDRMTQERNELRRIVALAIQFRVESNREPGDDLEQFAAMEALFDALKIHIENRPRRAAHGIQQEKPTEQDRHQTD